MLNPVLTDNSQLKFEKGMSYLVLCVIVALIKGSILFAHVVFTMFTEACYEIFQPQLPFFLYWLQGFLHAKQFNSFSPIWVLKWWYGLIYRLPCCAMCTFYLNEFGYDAECDQLVGQCTLKCFFSCMSFLVWQSVPRNSGYFITQLALEWLFKEIVLIQCLRPQNEIPCDMMCIEIIFHLYDFWYDVKCDWIN